MGNTPETALGSAYGRHIAALEDTVHRRSVDQVARMHRIMAANGGLLITTPRQNSSDHYVADWTTESEVMGRAHHWDLKVLLDELVTKHGFAEPEPTIAAVTPLRPDA